MHYQTLQIIDRLLTNCIEEWELESSFSDVLQEMTDQDREQLVPMMMERAKAILTEKGIDCYPTGIPDYIANKLLSIECWDEPMEDYDAAHEPANEPDYIAQEADEDEQPMFDLVNEWIDICIDDYHLGKQFVQRVREMNNAGRFEVADMIIERVRNDPDTLLLRQDYHDDAFDDFTKVLEARIAELREQKPSVKGSIKASWLP
jgi:uncharacterized membrane-anchored protein YjiN (DUF445 family)